jgi:hypothetical protein
LVKKPQGILGLSLYRVLNVSLIGKDVVASNLKPIEVIPFEIFDV